MKDFSPKQEKLLAALLTEKNLQAASGKAGLSEVTAWRYLRDETFVAEYRKLRRDAVEQAAAQLQQSTASAVEALQRNLTCGNPNAEISAAKIILEQSVKSIELLDLTERLETIEHELKNNNKKH